MLSDYIKVACHEFKSVSFLSWVHSKNCCILTWIRMWFNGQAPVKTELADKVREKREILSCRFFPNLPGRSYHNPHHRPQNLIPTTRSTCYQGVEKVMLLCGGISRLSRILVKVGSSTGVWNEASVGASHSIGWAFAGCGLLSCCQTPSSYRSQHTQASFMLSLSVFKLKLPW